jgi:hypothetical protein
MWGLLTAFPMGPMLRGVGWLSSLQTALAVLYGKDGRQLQATVLSAPTAMLLPSSNCTTSRTSATEPETRAADTSRPSPAQQTSGRVLCTMSKASSLRDVRAAPKPPLLQKLVVSTALWPTSIALRIPVMVSATARYS